MGKEPKVKFEKTQSFYKKEKSVKEGIPKALRYLFDSWFGQTKKRIIRNISGTILNARTGQLRRNIGSQIKETGSKISGVVGVGIAGTKNVVYARIHEKGGIIKPVRKKMLTVPVPGVKGQARNYPNAFIIKSKRGNLLIVEKQGGSIKPLFVLRKSVRIPERQWFSRSIDEMKPELNRLMAKANILSVAEKLTGAK